jgi:hypothetical protein
MNPHLSWHDSLITSMTDATPPCPIMIYEMKIDNSFVVDQLCLLEDLRYDYIGAGEQWWISNEIISDLGNNVVSAHEVGSSAGMTALCWISVTPSFQHTSDHQFSWWSMLPQNRRIVDCRCALFVGGKIWDKIKSELVNNVGSTINRRTLLLFLVDGPWYTKKGWYGLPSSIDENRRTVGH